MPSPRSHRQPGNSKPRDRSQTWAKPFWFPRRPSRLPRDPTTATQPEKKPEKINPNDIYTLSTTTNLVNVDVMVVDNNGSPLQNLEKKNFQLYDDGVPQAITNFGTGEAPMTICMLVEFANRWWPFLYIALRYSYSFLDVIHPKDWVAVVSFDLKSQILTDFTQDRAEVRAGSGSTAHPRLSVNPTFTMRWLLSWTE